MKGIVRKLVGVALIVTAGIVALTRYEDRPVEALVARWAPPPSEFIEVKGQVVHLRDEGPRGDPLPIVLIHGTGASLHTWEGWVAELKTQRRVVTFDLPGFGLTGPFAGQYAPGDYRGEAYARFVVDLLDRLQLQRVVIGGNSLGGEVAWRTAVLAPQRIERLILVDATGWFFEPQVFPPGLVMAWLPVVNRVGEYLLPRSVIGASLRDLYGDPSKISAAVVDRYFEMTLREGNRRALGQRMATLVSDLQSELIGKVSQPTLILWGEHDRLVPPVNAQRFATAIAGSQLVMLPGLGHMPQEEDPATSLAPVRPFLGLR